MADEVTREEKEALAEKIETFMSGLSDREADLFAAMVKPPEELDEVSGFGSSFGTPTAQLVDLRLGDLQIGSGYRQHLLMAGKDLTSEPHPIWGK